MLFWNLGRDNLKKALETKADKAEIEELKKTLSKFQIYLDNLHAVVVDSQEKRLVNAENKIRELNAPRAPEPHA